MVVLFCGRFDVVCCFELVFVYGALCLVLGVGCLDLCSNDAMLVGGCG